MLRRCYSDNFWYCFLWERWRKGQKRRRRKRCQRESHAENYKRNKRGSTAEQLLQGTSRQCVLFSFTLDVDGPRKQWGEINCICGGCNGALKGEIPVRRMDEFGRLWNQKVHLLKLPEYQPVTDSAMSENPGELRKWSGNTTSPSLLILTTPALMEMLSSGWKRQLASPTGAAGSRKLSPLCGSCWLLHLFSFCHQTLLFKLLGRISQ